MKQQVNTSKNTKFKLNTSKNMSLTTNSLLQVTTKARNSLLQAKHNQVWVGLSVLSIGRFVELDGSVSR